MEISPAGSHVTRPYAHVSKHLGFWDEWSGHVRGHGKPYRTYKPKNHSDMCKYETS